ncbi:MAG TPA: response regulator transcription factor [Fimbriimonadaceae bacterium]|nr:response regulator transcription factor [Fimbriimonadaceae bacterium]
MIRILIVDDHEMVREGLRALLSGEDKYDIVGEAKDGMEAVRMTSSLKPDLVLMDIQMPQLDGIKATEEINQHHPDVRVLVLTTFLDASKVRAALKAGAVGYLLKNVRKDEIFEAISSVMTGSRYVHPDAVDALERSKSHALDRLTIRERDVLAMIAHGKSNKEIANELFLTEGTVKGYVSAVLSKIGVQDRTQAAIFAVRNEII